MTNERESVELSAYLDGELTGAERAQVEKRLASDLEARKALQALERTQTLIASTMEDVDLTAAVRERVESMEPEANAGTRRYLVPAVAAAVVLFAALAGISWLGEDLRPAVETAAPVDESPRTPADSGTPEATADAASAEDLSNEQAPAPDAAVDPIMAQEDPPIDAFEQLPDARVPYTLLAVDITQNPPLAYFQPTRGDTVDALSMGDDLPDGAPLAWVGPEGIILGGAGNWQRMNAPSTQHEGLAGVWSLELLIEGEVVHGASELEIAEGANGRFRIPLEPLSDDLMGTREGNRLDVSIEPGDWPSQSGMRVQLSGTVTADRDAFELVGLVEQADDEFAERMATTIRAERMTPLEVAQAAHARTQQQQRRRVMDGIRNAIVAFYNREDRLPRNDAELLEAIDEHAAPLRATLEGASSLRYAAATPTLMPYESHQYEQGGDPDSLYQYEARMIARHGKAAPLPDTILTVAFDDTGERHGLSLNPFGLALGDALTAWSRQVQEPQSEAEWNVISAQSQNNLKQLGLVIKMFENEHHEHTPPGWWSVYPEYRSDLSILTHPLDDPGTLSYEYFLPSTNIRQLLQDVHGEEALVTPAEHAQSMSALPMAAEAQAYGYPPSRNVLFADGHVERMTEQDYQRLIREWFQ